MAVLIHWCKKCGARLLPYEFLRDHTKVLCAVCGETEDISDFASW